MLVAYIAKPNVLFTSAMKSDSHGLFGGENILIVDDTLESIQSFSANLSENEYTVQSAIFGSMTLIIARLTRPNSILLDIKMPKIDGYKVCKKLKESKNTSNTPIIFLSCLDNVSAKIKAFKVGGADYMTKPFQIEEVLPRVKHQVTIKKINLQIKEQNQQLKNEAEERPKTELLAVAVSEAKTLFLANTSHELRTPLNAIIGFYKLSNNKSLLNAEQQESLNIINRSAENLLALINDVLKLSIIELGAIHLDSKCFDLYHLLDNLRTYATVMENKVFQAFKIPPTPFKRGSLCKS